MLFSASCYVRVQYFHILLIKIRHHGIVKGISMIYMVRRTISLRSNIRRLTMKLNINLLTFILVVLGAINWTLFGVMGVNLVHDIFGGSDVVLKVVYFLIGLSGLHMMTHYKTLVK